MTTIKQADFIQSIADALQYISYYHPTDYIQALGEAYKLEESPAAKDAIAQILTNSRMCAEGKRPICQDTGIVVAFVKVGMNVRFDSSGEIESLTLEQMVNEGVRRAYLLPENKLRASIVTDPAGKRTNTKDNTPAVVHVSLVAGDTVEVSIAAKGGGSENKAQLAMLNPNDSIVDWILEVVPQMGAGWCPPGMLGIGIGGSAEKAVLLAKESLMAPIDMHELKLKDKRSLNKIEELRLEIFEKVNNLGIGAQGLGGLATVLDVKILDYPTHAASLPVAIIPNCAATRHVHFVLDGTGAAELTPPDLSSYPDVHWVPSAQAKRVNVDGLTKADIADWQAGETLLLTGKILTGRDAAHKRIATMLAKNETLPVDFTNRFIYYVGPVDAVGDEAVGPAGPTTATRMDDYTELMLGKLNLLGSIGKAERGDEALAVIKKHKSVYLMAVGGAAFLVSKAIKKSRVVAFADLGMEAIYEFDVVDMPVTVAVSATGESVHQTGPAIWQDKIRNHKVIEITALP
ncbi:fumarate hydratase [Methylotenera versatilis]|uniref:fumarate hydratase n=1 Tax=Methylotenera versatilis TaxID=1055487 RepID=UPI0006465216|nr:fumarate hydratase [Methylotenera versatilis]